jgi:hypothetical protein
VEDIDRLARVPIRDLSFHYGVQNSSGSHLASYSVSDSLLTIRAWILPPNFTDSNYPSAGREATRGSGVAAPHFSSLGSEWLDWIPCQFSPGDRAPCTHCRGGWVGPRAGLDSFEKRKFSFPCQKCNQNFLVVQRVAQTLHRLTLAATIKCV